MFLPQRIDAGRLAARLIRSRPVIARRVLARLLLARLLLARLLLALRVRTKIPWPPLLIALVAVLVEPVLI